MLDHGVRALLDMHPLLVIAALIFIEELGIPSPIPGDLMMILAGVKVSQGVYPLWLVLVVMEGATMLGTTGLFLLSRRAGRPVVERYGRYIHLGPETLARAETQIRHSGGRAIVLGRLIPGLRIVTPVAGGTLGMTARQFLPAVALGAFGYLLVPTLLGRVLGPTALALFERVTRAAGAFVSLLVLAVLLVLVRQLKRELPPAVRGNRAPAPAAFAVGVLSGTAALLAMNGILELVSRGLRLSGRRVPTVAPVLTRSGEVSTGWHLLLGWPVFIIVAGLVAVLVERIGRSRLTRSGAIIFGAGIPLGVSILLIAPLIAHPLPGLARNSGTILLALEILRWIAFGIALGDFLPIAVRLRPLPRVPVQAAPTATG